MEKRILVAVRQPGEGMFEKKIVDNTLESFQTLVGGYIEPVMLPEGILAIVNEEGVLMDLDFNLTINGYHLFGPVVLVREDGEDFGSLTEKQLNWIAENCNDKYCVTGDFYE